eukprot:m.230804 g.230804  ORF g.230804 m.230804 type:complete len:166 (-) comp16002_c0_seq23:486-983(-)
MISSLLQVDVQSDKGREHISGLMTMVLPAIIVATGSVPLPVLSSCLEEAIQYYPVEDTARSEKLISEFGASLLYAVCRGADTQLGSGSVPAEQQNEWTANVARFASTQVLRSKQTTANVKNQKCVRQQLLLVCYKQRKETTIRLDFCGSLLVSWQPIRLRRQGIP